jgi:L-fucose isomerase-like protein
MARVALLTLSDGRDFVARDLTGFCREAEDAVAVALAAAGHEVERGSEPVSTSDVATSSARRLAASQPDLTIFHYPVWAFPHFTMVAASATAGPLLLLGSIDPAYPGMVGMLSAGGALDQIGRTHVRAFPGDATLARLTRQAHNYRMQVVRGSFVSFDDEVNQALMRQSTFEWPHAFARLYVDSAEFLSRFGANHIHAVPGDRIAELQAACTFLGISFEPLGSPPG